MARQIIVLGLGFVLLAVSLFPTQAQGGTLRQIVDSRSDLSTLSVFIDASLPSVRTILEDSGPLTLFAPTNTAFENLASFLDVTLADLLQDPIVVSQIVEYHLLDGAFTARELATNFNGQVVPTRLPLAFVSVRTNDQGGLSLNNVVEIIEFDINGSNGVLHVVNDVLLNRIIAETLEAQLNSARPLEAITPNPDSTAERTAIVTPTAPEAAAPAGVAVVRLAHFSPTTQPIAVLNNSQSLIPSLAYPDVSDLLQIPAGAGLFEIAAAENSSGGSSLASLDLMVEAGMMYTLIAMPAEPLEIVLLEAALMPISADNNRVQFFHGALNSPSVRLQWDEDTQFDAVVANAATPLLDLPNGIYNPVLINDSTNETLFEPLRMSLWGGTDYFFALVGPPDDLRWIAQSTSSEALLALGDMPAPSTIQRAEPTPAVAADLTLLEVIADAEDLTILAQALEQVDPALSEQLTLAERGLTFFAPTDAAFEALLSLVSLSVDDLLDDTDLLTALLSYHLTEGRINGDDLRSANGASLTTFGGALDTLLITVTEDDMVLVNGVSQVLETDTSADNGVLHRIDEVLLPQSVVEALGL